MTPQQALAILRAQYGPSPICCNCPTPGARGDGHLQPPDPPECCGQFEGTVNDLLSVLEGDALRWRNLIRGMQMAALPMVRVQVMNRGQYRLRTAEELTQEMTPNDKVQHDQDHR